MFIIRNRSNRSFRAGRGGWRRVFKVFLAPAALLLGSACNAQQVEITIDPAQRFQTMSGWELNSEIADVESGRDRALPRYGDALMDLAVDRVGVNRLRVEVRSGAENTDANWRRFAARQIDAKAWRPLRYATVNDNADPQVINWAGFDFSELDNNIEQAVIPMRRRLEARGERLFVNLCYVAFTDQLRGGAYHHDDAEEYAEFVLATYLHMQSKWGFVPDTWEVILEPDLVGRWDGREIGERIVATAARLQAHGFTPRFVTPSVVSMAAAAPFIDGIAKVDGAMAHVEEFSYHRYRGVSSRALEAIAERAARYGKRTAMLEFWFGQATHEVLREDLTEGVNSAWQGQALMDLVDLDLSDPQKVRMSLRQDSRMNAQYFRFVRSGAHRIGARSSAARELAPVAFVNANGAAVVVLDARHPVNAVTVRGLPAGSYRISLAAGQETRDPAEIREVGADGALTLTIPEAGVVSIYDVRSVPSRKTGAAPATGAAPGAGAAPARAAGG